MFTAETRLSEWLESMRKDVECTFGILKGRFRILKAGIMLHGVDVADSIWLTCCALHNMLLEIDGITGEWDGINGLFDIDTESDSVPFGLTRLTNPSTIRNYDTSGMGHGNANLYDSDIDVNVDIPDVIDDITHANDSEIDMDVDIPDVIDDVTHTKCLER